LSVEDGTYDDACKNQDSNYDEKNFLYAHCRFLSHLSEASEMVGSRYLPASTEAEEIAFRPHCKTWVGSLYEQLCKALQLFARLDL
jgi:hypothetical protein